MRSRRIAVLTFGLLVPGAPPAAAVESGCPGSAQPDPAILFCEDYEDPAPLGSRFVEHNTASGSFVRVSGEGVGGGPAMRATWQPGQVGAGWMIRTFGRTPPGFYAPQSHGTRDFREIYWREYFRTAPGWSGNPHKLSRVYGIANASWAQSMIAHLWGPAESAQLSLDPASGIGQNDQLITTSYNDSAHLRWLGGANAIDPGWSGNTSGSTAVFASANANRWYCAEAHARLNTPGQADGVFEFWIDGQLEARLTGLNWVGRWQAYGINGISLENYWNGGSPQLNVRYRDNLIVSTARIGCLPDRNAPDTDGDATPDDADNCPADPNPDQGDRDLDFHGDGCDRCPDHATSDNSDFDGNGIGDECECGDQIRDSVVDVLDIVGINLAIFGAAQASSLCDANNDQLCNVSDVVAVNQKIFGQPAYCSRYPPLPGP
jgi:hypothetical protein